MNINGIKRKLSEDGEVVYYYTDSTLMNDIIFVQDTLYSNDDYLKITLSVIHSNISDARYYQLYEGDYLSTIQVYGMVKNVVDLHDYNTNNLEDFFNMLHELSDSTMFSSYQSDEEGEKEISEWIRGYFIGLSKVISDKNVETDVTFEELDTVESGCKLCGKVESILFNDMCHICFDKEI